MNIQGIVFDFDGVLGDTVGTHNAARIQAFKDCDFDVSPDLHEQAHRHGSHPPEIIGWVLKQAGFVSPDADVMTDPVVQKVVGRKEELYKLQAATGLNA